jgi:hypothetical protein
LSDRWTQYAQRHLVPGIARTAYNTWLSHSVSLGYLLAWKPPPARFLSIGCGAGFFDVLVAAYGYEVTSVDNDPAVLEVAKRIARCFDVRLELQQAYAFDLKEHHDRYDVAFSAGLVEHWHGARTVELIREHSRCAPLVQVEVPTAHTLRIDAVPEVVEDMHLHTTRDFRARVIAAGLHPLKLYPIGSGPTRRREILESLLPPAFFRRLQLLTNYAMGIGCIARRPPGG